MEVPRILLVTSSVGFVFVLLFFLRLFSLIMCVFLCDCIVIIVIIIASSRSVAVVVIVIVFHQTLALSIPRTNTPY